jgi:Glycosyltransferase family 87
MPIPRTLLAKISMDVTIILGGALVVLRLMNVAPWTLPILDLHTYWESRDVINYAAYTPYQIGAFIYSPAFAQLIAPITTLSWPGFAGVWTAILLGAYLWLAGRWSLPLLLTIAVPLELYLGQIDILLAAAIVIGFRYPVAWAFPLLTKIAPGIGLLWFAFRREWRNLALALAATVGIAAVSAVFMPELWRGWVAFLVRSVTTSGTVDGAYLGIPLWLRLPVAVATIAWGARTDRQWTVPIAVLLAMPILWVNVFSLLLAVVPLHPRFGLTPARAWLTRVPWHAPKLVPVGEGLTRRV